MTHQLVARLRQAFGYWPDRLCLRDTSLDMTFAEVDALSDDVARRLAALPDAGPIAFSAVSDLRIYVLFLACIKAGRACVPLNPTLSATNVTGILRMLGDIRHVYVNAARDDLDVVGITRVPLDSLFQGDVPQDVSLTPADPDAPLIYQSSSGSTGTPKIIPMSANNLLHQIEVYTRIGGYRPDAAHGICGDWLPKQVMAAMVNGMANTICLVGDASLQGIIDWMTGHRVGYLTIYLARLRLFADLGVTFPALKQVMIGGEVVTRAHLAMAEAFTEPGSRIINLYGSQETGSVSVGRLPHGASRESGPVTIGTPLFEGALDIVDDAGQPVSGQTEGELVVRFGYNDVVTSGYVGSTKAIRRLPDGAYCTGDWGYRAKDGQYHVLGRRDDVVKISAYNVPLSEIEAAMRGVPGVTEAAVKAISLNETTRVLSAYYEGTAPEARVRQALQEALPRFMRPHYLRRMLRLPRTGTGKIKKADITFSTAPVTPFSMGQGKYFAQLARIWRALLTHAHFDEYASFFSVGGDSLTSIQLMLEIEKTFGVRVSVAPFLDRGACIAGLAALLDEAEAPEAGLDHPQWPGSVTAEQLWEMNNRLMRGWGGTMGPTGHFISPNHGVEGPAVVWVLQGLNEYQALSQALGPDVPFYAARSFASLPRQIDATGRMVDRDLYTPETIGPTVRAYVHEISQLTQGRGLVLAGNCQAVHLLQGMLDVLCEMDVPVLGALALNPVKPVQLAGPVRHLAFGSEELAEFKADFGAPETHAGITGVDQLPGAHGHYFQGAALQILTRRLLAMCDSPIPAQATAQESGDSAEIRVISA